MNALFTYIPGMRSLAKRFGIAVPSKRDAARDLLLKTLPVGSVGAEIGVHLGDFSEEILTTIKPKVLHLIDPWEFQESPTYQKSLYGGEDGHGVEEMNQRYQGVCARFTGQIENGTIKIHRAYSNDALESFEDGALDWVYIDGNHLYDFVMQDLMLSFRKVRPGGYITGDDYGDGGWWQGGVKKAVDEFIKDNAVTPIAIKGGQFILRRE